MLIETQESFFGTSLFRSLMRSHGKTIDRCYKLKTSTDTCKKSSIQNQINVNNEI